MMFCIMDKDNRICGESTQIFGLCPTTRKVKFKSTLNIFLITSITDKLFLINTNIRVSMFGSVTLIWLFAVLSMVHGKINDIYFMIQILD